MKTVSGILAIVLFVGFAMCFSSCSLMRSPVIDPRVVVKNQALEAVAPFVKGAIVPSLESRVKDGVVAVDQNVTLTDDTRIAIVRANVSDARGTVVDFYMIVSCVKTCEMVGMVPIVAPGQDDK